MQLTSRTARVRGSHPCCIGTLPAAVARLPLQRLTTQPRFHQRQTACSAMGPGGGKGPQDKDPLFKRLAREAERHAHHLIDTLTPKHEYDLADVTLIFVSTLVFMWLAACLYRLYAFAYYAF